MSLFYYPPKPGPGGAPLPLGQPRDMDGAGGWESA